jgi:Uma2 family endonuclease
MSMTLLQSSVTPDEFERIILRPENQDRRLELINGVMVEKLRAQLQAYILGQVAGNVTLYLQEHPIGYGFISARYRLPDSPQNDLIPDFSFQLKERGPILSSGPAPYMPDLAVEAQSEGQSDKFMADKAKIYLDNGARMVWIIYSTRQIVEVLTPTDRALLTINDTLKGGDVLPGFELAVSKIFPV